MRMQIRCDAESWLGSGLLPHYSSDVGAFPEKRSCLRPCCSFLSFASFIIPLFLDFVHLDHTRDYGKCSIFNIVVL